jgi:transaldolase/glucose-6-phosphate isomerase
MAGNPPVDVQAFGQSIWYDNIRRRLIENGELARLIAEDGVLGVTSNPTIFQKAIGNSADYDASLVEMLDLEPDAIFENLAIADIQRALDLFLPVYERTQRRDGYVSLEVSPLLANDTQTTVEAAKRLFAALDRPNAMIKIPATEAGLPAIEEAIAAGININVTLIFGIQNYLAVAEAYIRGLERRLEAGQPVDHIASVASFFLSRIDTMVDKMLDNNIRAAQGRDLARVALNNRLKGKTAIANAKVAYRHFLELFEGERFARLRAAGAQVQRLLWASTGTKNPAYPDTMYLDSLIGRDTVNTVPPETLAAFKDHGTVGDTLREGLDDAQQTLDMLAEVNIDLDSVTDQLQTDGVEAFVDSFRSLIEQVDAKRNVLKTGVMKQMHSAIGPLADDVSAAIKDLDAQHAAARIWEHDGSFWKDNPQVVAKINDRLGWLDTHKTIDLARLHALQDRVAGENLDAVILLGMGGSSLAPEVMARTFGRRDGFPRLLMLDSTDPAYIRHVEQSADLTRSVFIVASKSGGTIETSTFFEYFYERTGGAGERFIAITDPGTVLEKLASEKGFRDTFLNPPDIGGRYSALSYFGMVPAALLGFDLDALWASAGRMMTACGPRIPGADHPGIVLGAIMGAAARRGQDKATLICSPSISVFGNWVEQLVAESTGKENRGIIPVVGATPGRPHDYSTDRLFIYLRVESDDNAALDSATLALQEAGHPCVTLDLTDTYALGGEFFRWEFATAIAGRLLEINPFDEPNVTESKQNTARLLDHYQQTGALPALSPAAMQDGVGLYADERNLNLLRTLAGHHRFESHTVEGLLAALLNGTNAGDYFAMLAYLPMFDEVVETLEDIRRRLRHNTRRAVTLGFGPRFLHSTGQLHKGGPNNGVFIQLVYEDPFPLPIPNYPYSFSVLKAAQADGDLEALQNKGRRSVRLHLGGDFQRGLQVLGRAVDRVGERRI